MPKLVTPRKRKDGIATIGELAPELQQIIESRRQKALTAEQPPQPVEIIPPEPNTEKPRNGFVEKHRPDGPAKRGPEDAAASFVSDDLRIIKDGHMWQVDAKRPLTGDEKDRLYASGFTPVDDYEQVWNASQADLIRAGTDINIVAMALGKPAVMNGRAR